MNDLPAVPPAQALPRSVTDVRALLPWYVAEFLNCFAMLLAVNAVFFFARYELQCSAATLLWLMVISGALCAAAAFTGGKIVSRLGQRRVLITAGLVTMAIYVFGAWALHMHSLAILFVLVALLNLSVTPGWPSLESAITQSPARMKLATRITLYNLGWSSSTFLALCVTGTVAKYLS